MLFRSDRGFMFPELGKSALQEELEEIRSRKFDGYYSSARTCEINLKDHTDANFESIVYLVDEVLSFT